MKPYLIIPILALIFLGCSTPEPEPLNILVIAIDDMNNWIGVMEDEAKTPHIDDLARSGVLFNNAYCVVPACNPSRTSLMTGLDPRPPASMETVAISGTGRGAKDLLTMPQYFREYGYEAVAAGKIYHWSRGTGEKPAALSDPASWNYQRRGRIGTPGMDLYQDQDGKATWLEGAWKRYLDSPTGKGGLALFYHARGMGTHQYAYRGVR